jgi:signal transduction histidine kinase
MANSDGPHDTFEAEVVERFGFLPNFYRAAQPSPDLRQQLWGFTKAGYLDNPMPSLFKERLFVWLSRFCPIRYSIVRHVGFLLGPPHGHAAGDAVAEPQSPEAVGELLRRPSPWQRDMLPVYALLEARTKPIDQWPDPGTELEDALFACAASIFVEPARSQLARHAVERALGARGFELFSGMLAFVRTAHYWTMLHPDLEAEDDMRQWMDGHEELARLLLEDPEAERCEMGGHLFAELTSLRDLHERAQRALEEKDRQKDRFIAVLGHELRNPLAAIRASVDAMTLLGAQDARAARLIERVDRQTTALSRMVVDLLDASRIALGKLSLESERLDLAGLLSDMLAEQQPRAQDAGLALLTDVTGAPVLVEADPVRLRQILDNLVGNAIKFTPAGGTIRIALVEDGTRVAVAVRDSGVGFDAQLAREMFEPFAQRDQGRDRAAGGLGLGLAIARRLAELHGGSLSATSDGPGQGAVFTLTMPAARPDAVPGPDPSTPRVRTVLIVEDNRDAADSLAELLDLTGMRVAVARAGPEAIVLAHQIVPDLILCDLGLPGEMDGLAVARTCRADEALRSIRLVALSGYSSPQDHADAREAGFEYLLAKPLTREALARMTGTTPSAGPGAPRAG